MGNVDAHLNLFIAVGTHDGCGLWDLKEFVSSCEHSKQGTPLHVQTRAIE